MVLHEFTEGVICEENSPDLNASTAKMSWSGKVMHNLRKKSWHAMSSWNVTLRTTQSFSKMIERSWKMFYLTWWFLMINYDQSWFPNFSWERRPWEASFLGRVDKDFRVPWKRAKWLWSNPQGSHSHVLEKFPDFLRQIFPDFPWPPHSCLYPNEAVWR